MARHILIIDAHPDSSANQFVHALADAYAKGAESAGHEARIIRLAELDFPLLRSERDWHRAAPPAIAEAQAAILWAQHIAIFYPLWLGDMPALLKAFLEQVMRPGFAFDQQANPMKAGLLGGRSARIVVTMGMPALVYRLFFGAHSLRSFKWNVLRFVGIRPVKATVIGGIESDTGRRRRQLQAIRALGSKAA